MVHLPLTVLIMVLMTTEVEHIEVLVIQLSLTQSKISGLRVLIYIT